MANNVIATIWRVGALSILLTLLIANFKVHGESWVDEEVLRNSQQVYTVDWIPGEYRLVLGSVKKVNGQWFAGKQKMVNGMVARNTYELDALLNFRSVKQLVQTQLKHIPQENVLFVCSGLDCGSSNAWANEFFQIKQLYGLDTNQFYAAVQEAGVYQVLYLVQRGNKRIYLQWDQVKPNNEQASNPSIQLVQALENKGFWVVPFEPTKEVMLTEVEQEALQPLVQLLQQNPTWRIAVVGHSAAGVETALTFAQRVSSSLQKSGVNSQQLQTHSVGALAPRAKVASERVEIVWLN